MTQFKSLLHFSAGTRVNSVRTLVPDEVAHSDVHFPLRLINIKLGLVHN